MEICVLCSSDSQISLIVSETPYSCITVGCKAVGSNALLAAMPEIGHLRWKARLCLFFLTDFFGNVLMFHS